MKNRFHSILALICALAMLCALLPAAYADQEITVPEATQTEDGLPEETPEEGLVMPKQPEEETKQVAEPVNRDPADGEPADEESADKEPVAEESAEEEPTDDTSAEEPDGEVLVSDTIASDAAITEEPAAEMMDPEIKADAKDPTELNLTAEKLRVVVAAKESGMLRLTLLKAVHFTVTRNDQILEPVKTEQTDCVIYEFEAEKGKNILFIQSDSEVTVKAKAKTMIPDETEEIPAEPAEEPEGEPEEEPEEKPAEKPEEEPEDDAKEDNKEDADNMPAEDLTEETKAESVEEPTEVPEKDEKEEPAEEPEKDDKEDSAEDPTEGPKEEPVEKPVEESGKEPEEEPAEEPEVPADDLPQEPTEEPKDETQEEPDENKGEPLETKEEPADEPELAPERSVKLVSTLDGLTEIYEGTEIVMTVEISGFSEEDIASVTWQYRPADEEDFYDIEGADGLTYTYPISAENIHYEWRIMLTMKP